VLCFWLKKESDNQTEEVNTVAKKTLGQAGLDLIKSFEGCRLTAYKPVPTEKYWTIGWGHYGEDVVKGMTITQARADELLMQDVADSVAAVNNPYYCPITASLNQNQFDALVSFAFNCGAGNLKTLCANRTAAQIAEKIPAYNKAGGNVLAGLVRRRAAEQALFNKAVGFFEEDMEPSNVKEVQTWLNRNFSSGLVNDGLYGTNTRKALTKALQKTLGLTADGIYGSKTHAAVKTLKKGDKGTLVKILQCFLICHKQKITADGEFGAMTELALKTVQSHYKIDNDGIAGKMTFRALCS
jgi:GH24 family phage-related lysozyme (muramidase)